MPLDLDPRAAALLDPVRAVVDAGLERLGSTALTVGVGPVDGFWAWDGERLVLSERLEGPDLHHPAENARLPLDRWRRAAASVLEGAASRSVPLGAEAPSWLRSGLAIDAADRAAPDLGLAEPDVARAIETGDLDAWPRGGVAVVRAWRREGLDPAIRATAPVSAAEWLAAGVSVLDPAAVASLPVPVPRVVSRDIPLDLGPWRWQPLEVPAHPRGGRVAVEGAGEVGEAWAIAKRPLRTLAASVGPARFLPEVGGPVGRFTLKTAQGFGQVYGARGLAFRFRGGGGFEVEAADAFVGPVTAAAVAEQMGTSGIARGTWEVAGPQRLRFDRIDAQGLAMHGRRISDPVLPANELGMGVMLQALQDDVWEWALEADRLSLRGRIMGGSVEIRLQRDG